MTGLRYVSLISSTATRSTYVYSLFDPRNGGPLYSNFISCFLTLRGPLHTISSHNGGSSFCTATGLDLRSENPEYKLTQKKKKKEVDS